MTFWEWIKSIFRKPSAPMPPEPGFEYIVRPVEKPADAPVSAPSSGKRYLDSNGRLLINQAGMDLVKHFEGYYEKAYADPVGIITIGFGTITYPNGKKVQRGDTCTEEEATSWLMHDLWDDGAKYVRAYTDDAVEKELNENQLSALVSLTYNRGGGRFREFIAPHLNNRDFPRALQELTMLNWAISNGARKYLLGLDRRRWAERYLWEGKNWRAFESIAEFSAFKAKGYRA